MTPDQLARALANLAPALQRALLAQLIAWEAQGRRAAIRDVEAAMAAGDTRGVVRLLLGDRVANTVSIGPPQLPDAARAFVAIASPAAIAAASRTEQALIRATADAAIQASRVASALLPPIPPTVRVVAAASSPAPFSGVVTITQTTLPAAAVRTEAKVAVSYGGDALRYLRATAHEGIVAAVQAGNAAGINPRETARALRDVVGLGEHQALWVQNFRHELESGQLLTARSRKLVDGRMSGLIERRKAAGKALTSPEIDKLVATYADKWRAFHAETIARTVSLDLLRAASIAKARAAVASGVYGDAPVTKRWVTRMDGRERPAHHDLNGSTIPLNAQWLDDGVLRDVPGGWNCYTGDTVVRGSVQMILRSRYEGPIIHVVTAAGSRLSVTPNHPVLTPEGFTVARALCEGMDVICDRGDVRFPAVRLAEHSHNDDAPATIEQLYDLAAKDRTVLRRHRVDTDLHGDAQFGEGDINAVLLHGELLDGLLSDRSQAVAEWSFKTMDEPAAHVPSHGAFDLSVQRNDTATNGVVRSHHLLRASDSIHPAPLQALSIALIAPLNASVFEDAKYQRPTYAMRGRNKVLAVASDVGRDDLAFRNPLAALHARPTVPAQRDSKLPKHDIERRHAYLMSSGNIRQGNVLTVGRDQVVSVVRGWHHGFVYDCMTGSGLQSAARIVLSNCRCAMVIRFGIV